MRKFLLTAAFLALSITSACSESALTEPEKRFPEPVKVYDDTGDAQATPTPVPTQLATISGPQAQFECVAGAPDSTASMKSESADRDDDAGQPMTVRVYDPAGAQVFGFAVTVFETFQYMDGRTGIAAYVAPQPSAVLPAILKRFPGSSSPNGKIITGPGMAGTISLGSADLGGTTLTRIECAAGN